MSFLVGLTTRLGVGEREAAIEDHPVGIIQMCGEVFSGYEGVGKHDA
jgi:hypothetical protein